MTISEAQQAIDWFQAQTGRIGTEGSLANDAARIALQDKLGVGQLGLGQAQLEANYGLGQGRLALDQQLGMLGLQNDWMRILVQLLGAQAAQNT